MLTTLFRERGDANDGVPHLSFSRINRYLTCPEQYRLYYVEQLRPRVPSASLVFGNIVHQALAGYLLGRHDPVACFVEMWAHVKQVPLGYGERDSWERLNAVGTALLRRFDEESSSKLGSVQAVERPFSISISGISIPIVGILDLLAELDGKLTIIDFKTAAASYGDDDGALSDQLTLYQLAEPSAEQLALCVLVKTKEPKIQWHLTRRTGDQLAAFVAKAKHVFADIAAARYYTRPGMWCAWCDYRSLCVGNTAKAAELLVKLG